MKPLMRFDSRKNILGGFILGWKLVLLGKKCVVWDHQIEIVDGVGK